MRSSLVTTRGILTLIQDDKGVRHVQLFGSAMPKPLEVFDDPQKYWSLLTSKRDVDLEDQFFDRKEAGRADPTGSVSGSQISSLIDRDSNQ